MAAGLRLDEISLLVVEDDTFTRNLILSILRNLGVRTIAEANGAGMALEMMATTEVDIIISDIQMSPVNGIDFLRHLRAGTRPAGVVPPQAPPSQIPVIFLTAHAQAKLVELARAAGVSAFLTKPIRPALLRDRLLQISATLRRQEPAPTPDQSAQPGSAGVPA
ncbi:response regulator [Skermanella pratensis]|uniref:response regulator n=1 Tax=Skermanella pratensis TaxID=2233999 RepID=UPI001300DBB0|nr:response regulator [Skermanella pratensis]